jgi:hypothetical protein
MLMPTVPVHPVTALENTGAGSSSTVHDNLMAMRGVWHDHLQGYAPDGSALTFDQFGAIQGPYPFEYLVYIDFDGQTFRQTAVVVAGRAPAARSFSAQFEDGYLRFASNGPGDPGIVGVSGGPNMLVFTPAVLADTLWNFHDPDWITFTASTRQRVTTLYRGGQLRRILRVDGVRVADEADRRVEWDPRGADGPVHAEAITSKVYVDPDAHAIEPPFSPGSPTH